MNPAPDGARWLTLVRHAQAQSPPGGTPDPDRALTARGRRDAAALAALLADPDPALAPVDRVACSDAMRTRQTLEILRPALGPAGDGAELDAALYLASADALARRAHALFEAGARHPMIVGHNPGLEDLCARLIGAPGLAMDTCARFTLRFDGRDTGPGDAVAVRRDVPRG